LAARGNYDAAMKHSRLSSIAHNLADSLSCGLGFVIGYYGTDIYGEAAKCPESSIFVDFLKGEISAGTPSLAKAVALYSQVLPDFCKKHRVEVSEFQIFRVRYAVSFYGPRYTVEIEDRSGRHSSVEYAAYSGRRLHAA
jgi:hypothetical protein